MMTLTPSVGDFKRLLGIIFAQGTFIGPKYAMIDIANDCDLYCKMCFNHSPLLRKTPDYEKWKSKLMSYEIFSFLLTELSQLKTEIVCLCGEGEPFLHPKIKEMIALLAKYKFKIQIITNGIHIKEDIMNDMLKMRLYRLTFSVHAGDGQTYKAVHPLREEELFCSLKERMTYLSLQKRRLRSKYPQVSIINVISRLNYDNIPGMVQFAQLVGANRICFKPLMVKEETKEPLSLEPRHIDKIREDLSALRKNLKLEHNIDEFLYSLINSYEGAKRKNSLIRNGMCYLPWVRTNIMSDGTVIGCIYQGNNCLGDIARNSFRDIWNSNDYIEFRNNKFCPEYCLGASVYPFVNILNRVNTFKNKLCISNREL